MRPELNRHGVPLRGQPPEQCIWPRCPSPVNTLPLTHLCDEHAILVHNAVAQSRIEPQVILSEWLEPAKPAATRPPRAEVIYYVQIGGHIKIGWTGQLEQRMRQYPPNSTLLAVHPGSRADERDLHKRFAVHRSHGQEWYPLVPVILQHIDRMIRAHGKPADVSFGARPVEVPVPRPKATLQAKYGPQTVT